MSFEKRLKLHNNKLAAWMKFQIEILDELERNEVPKYMLRDMMLQVYAQWVCTLDADDRWTHDEVQKIITDNSTYWIESIMEAEGLIKCKKSQKKSSLKKR